MVDQKDEVVEQAKGETSTEQESANGEPVFAKEKDGVTEEESDWGDWDTGNPRAGATTNNRSKSSSGLSGGWIAGLAAMGVCAMGVAAMALNRTRGKQSGHEHWEDLSVVGEASLA